MVLGLDESIVKSAEGSLICPPDKSMTYLRLAAAAVFEGFDCNIPEDFDICRCRPSQHRSPQGWMLQPKPPKMSKPSEMSKLSGMSKRQGPITRNVLLATFGQ